jgi:hypothetical protein
MAAEQPPFLTLCTTLQKHCVSLSRLSEKTVPQLRIAQASNGQEMRRALRPAPRFLPSSQPFDAFPMPFSRDFRHSLYRLWLDRTPRLT